MRLEKEAEDSRPNDGEGEKGKPWEKAPGDGDARVDPWAEGGRGGSPAKTVAKLVRRDSTAPFWCETSVNWR